MDGLKLPASIILVWDLRRSLEMGQSLQIGIKKYLERDIKSRFSLQFKIWWEHYRIHKQSLTRMKWNIYQRSLINLVQKGLEGLTIYEDLIELDRQMINSCEEDIEKHISLLPLILQIPLLGLLFPAILMLLLVPALKLLQV